MEKKSCSEISGIDETVVHPALKGYFTYRFFKAAMRLRASLNSALCEHGVVGPQLGLLRVLELTGTASQVELGRSMGIDKASMVKWIDSLERSGFVVRVADREDRRIKRIQITAKGSKKLKAASRIREGVEDKFFTALTKSERAELERILAKILP